MNLTTILIIIVAVGVVSGSLFALSLFRKSFSLSRFNMPKLRGNGGKIILFIIAVGSVGLLWWFWEPLHEKYQDGYIFGFLLLALLIVIAWLAGRKTFAKTGMAAMVVGMTVLRMVVRVVRVVVVVMCCAAVMVVRTIWRWRGTNCLT